MGILTNWVCACLLFLPVCNNNNNVYDDDDDEVDDDDDLNSDDNHDLQSALEDSISQKGAYLHSKLKRIFVYYCWLLNFLLYYPFRQSSAVQSFYNSFPLCCKMHTNLLSQNGTYFFLCWALAVTVIHR